MTPIISQKQRNKASVGGQLERLEVALFREVEEMAHVTKSEGGTITFKIKHIFFFSLAKNCSKETNDEKKKQQKTSKLRTNKLSARGGGGGGGGGGGKGVSGWSLCEVLEHRLVSLDLRGLGCGWVGNHELVNLGARVSIARHLKERQKDR